MICSVYYGMIICMVYDKWTSNDYERSMHVAYKNIWPSYQDVLSIQKYKSVVQYKL